MNHCEFFTSFYFIAGHEILNVIKDRQKLDRLYEENYQKQSTLLWQYIGSSPGVLSMYPGKSVCIMAKNEIQFNPVRTFVTYFRK